MLRPGDLGALLRMSAAEFGEQPAVIGESAALTFQSLDAEADRWARSFLAQGFGPGTHIGLLAGNSPDWFAAAFGAWRAGAVLVPISTFVTPRELAEILEHADIHVLVVQPRLAQHDYLGHLAELPSLPQLRAVVLLDHTRHPAYYTAPKWLAKADADTKLPSIVAGQHACILYTSGTTGRPKGVMLTHASILATVIPTAERGGLNDQDTLLSSLPLFWVAGLVIRALPTLISGCGLILLETFSASAAIEALRRHRPTALHLRPPQVAQILAHADFEPSLLAAVAKGGGRNDWFSPHMADARLITGYGMTEMSGYVTALSWQDPPQARALQIGSLLPGVEMRICTSSGETCAADTEGDVVVRGPGLFSGYYKEPAVTGLNADGWFRTGDLGRIDGNGVFHFSGRTKDLLRVKGINVSPLEVENILAGHPNVGAAYVVGVPLDGLDQQIVALIVAKDSVPSEKELRELATRSLSTYKRPAWYTVIEVDEVPLGGTSKPQRAALAELALRRVPALRRL